MREIFEIVKIFDGECSHNNNNGDTTRFRLEILRAIGKQIYVGKVYRSRLHRIQPTFPLSSQGVLSESECDAYIFVADDTFNFSQLNGASVEEILIKFESALGKIFG